MKSHILHALLCCALLSLFSSVTFCFGQNLANENGIIVTYKIGDKIGSRYDEYCKTTFDIYRVEGTVVNTNKDKAAMVTAILSFEGQTCNKIYSNDNNTTGEVINKMFNLDIWGQSGKQSQYWANKFVHLLPEESMTAKGHVEVQKDNKVQKPEIYFVTELISEKEKAKTENSYSTNINFATLILGQWDVTRKISVFTSGRQEEEGELFQSYIFKPNGLGEYQGNGENYDFKWHLSDNKVVCVYEDAQLNETIEIQKLDKTELILKGSYNKNSMGLDYWLYTFKKFEK